MPHPVEEIEDHLPGKTQKGRERVLIVGTLVLIVLAYLTLRHMRSAGSTGQSTGTTTPQDQVAGAASGTDAIVNMLRTQTQQLALLVRGQQRALVQERRLDQRLLARLRQENKQLASIRTELAHPKAPPKKRQPVHHNSHPATQHQGASHRVALPSHYGRTRAQ